MKTLKQCSKYSHLVQYYGNCKVGEDIWILMELCSEGSIKDILERRKELNEKQISEICSQVIKGLLVLHSLNLIHRDIKASNILLNDKAEIKLGDFGLLEHLSNIVGKKDLSGSIHWLSPEVIEQRNYSQKSDIWSLGITVIEMCENKSPYNQLEKPKKWSEELRNFVGLCLTKDPTLRASARMLSQHSLITKPRSSNPLKLLKNKRRLKVSKKESAQSKLNRATREGSLSLASGDTSVSEVENKLKLMIKCVTEKLQADFMESKQQLEQRIKELEMRNRDLEERLLFLNNINDSLGLRLEKVEQKKDKKHFSFLKKKRSLIQ